MLYVYLCPRLLQVSLDVADPEAGGAAMSGVENCACPEGYGGTSCEVIVHHL